MQRHVVQVVLMLTGIPLCAVAQDAGPSQQPTDRPSAEGIETLDPDKLVAQLGSRDFRERRQAENALLDLGVDAIDALADGFRLSDDFEARLRIRHVAEQIYYWARVPGDRAFLGISFYRRSSHRTHLGAPEIMAFEVAAVLHGTSAHRFGLELGDLIIAVDGVSVPASPTADLDFRELISNKIPGTIVTLQIERAERVIFRRVPIGPRHPDYIEEHVNPEWIKQYGHAVEQFASWWLIHFDRHRSAK